MQPGEPRRARSPKTKAKRLARRPASAGDHASSDSPEAHATLLELTGTLFAVLDTAGRIRSCSGAWQECLQLRREDMIDRALLDLVEPADQPFCRAGLQRSLAGHPPEEFAARFHGNGRGTVWLAVRPRVASSRDHLFLVARDITAEKLCAEMASPIELVHDELEEGVLVADATRVDLPVIHANAGFLRMSGYTAAEVRGRPLTMLAGPETDRAALEGAFSLARQGERSMVDVCYHRKDHAPFWVRLTLRPITGVDGTVRQIVALHLDVSELRLVIDALRVKNQALTEALESLQQTKEAIVQRERMHALGKMASGIVHDFNNLLAPILGFTELLLTIPDMMQEPERVAIYLQKIRTAANDGAAVVARLREFYRSRHDAEPPTPFSVRHAVEDTLELTRHRWRNEAHATGVRFEVETDLQDNAPAFGCASEIRQALTNLVLNSLDAMTDGGTLRLRSYTVGHWVCVQISDSGVGMSEEVRRRCFEPFFTTKGKSGTGLGLAIVFGIVERHRGRLELQSEEDRGTTFTLWLPACHARDNAGAGTAAGRDIDGGRALRVLVVDDEDLLLEVVSQHLLNMGHSVDCFTSPKAALECFYLRPHDLVITDRAMPGMTGDQLARLMREFKADTPIILLSGFGNIIKQHGEAPPNISEVLAKPLSHQTLREAVARHGGRCSAAGAELRTNADAIRAT